MNPVITNLLNETGSNHIFPFFWQHGEEENVLREYMGVIQDSGCGAVCVESRPHLDFCGPGWWHDMDIILDEARKRNMKVWILDDKHFPTGYANGVMENAPEKLCRQSICVYRNDFRGKPQLITLNVNAQIPPKLVPVGLEAVILPQLPTPRHYNDDSILSIIARNSKTAEKIDLTPFTKNGLLVWDKPEGDWTVWVTGLSRNCGPHRNYINMMDKTSCYKLIEEVYEKHWEHYAKDFGTTIAGFFSDEPELGNGHLYGIDDRLGTDQDLPFSSELPEELTKALGSDWANQMYLLWDNDSPALERAKVRYAFMDAVTRLVRKDFSRQIGDWCTSHGVQYIGHVVEDNNAHTRPASSLGHYFRGLDGQHMSGVDIISHQIMPQQIGDMPDITGNISDGEFYHFMLAKMASSAAAIEPAKQGRAMCEIFGNYGWGLTISLQKYLADHCLVRGVNYFVPHAFSPFPFPDPDCPPHFYAHGHNPQYRHFGQLCHYMNRVSELLSNGSRIAKTAIIYHAEAEWTGQCMLGQKPAHKLMEAQIDFDFLPCDVFTDLTHYHTDFSDGFKVNGRKYEALLLPAAQFITTSVAEACIRLYKQGIKVAFIDARPDGICDGSNAPLEALENIPVFSLDVIAKELKDLKTATAIPANPWLRVLHYVNGSDIFFITNEGTETWCGTLDLPAKDKDNYYSYDAYNNELNKIDLDAVEVKPLHSLIIIFDTPDVKLKNLLQFVGEAETPDCWIRSQCEGAAYPNFEQKTPVTLPDFVEIEQPEFSGFVRYETDVNVLEGETLMLSIDHASEGVEVFVNGHSAGIQIVPPFNYDLSRFIHTGKNKLVIEVATSLEREGYSLLTDPMMKQFTQKPTGHCGLTGIVTLYRSRGNFPKTV